MPRSIVPKALNAIYDLIEPHLSSMERSGIWGDHNNSGYHPSRNNLAGKGKTRGEDYSLVAPADLRGNGDYACAIDIKLNLGHMRVVTTRLRVACTPNSKGDYDPRIEPVREFIGSLDGRVVCGYNRYDSGGSGNRSVVGWHPSGYGDPSHQWHVHISVFRDRCHDANDMRGLAEVIAGVPAGTFGWTGKATAVDPQPVDPKPVEPVPAYLPIHYVDPAKVSTFLLGHKGDEPKKQREPGYAITTGVSIVKDGDRSWLVTEAGWAYDLDFLTTTKPEPVVAQPLIIGAWNTRRSSYEGDLGSAREWEKRDGLVKDFLASIGKYDALLTCETTKTQTTAIAGWTGMEGTGNGLGGHPKDVSGDNTAVFIDPAKLERLKVITVNTGGAGARFLTAVQVRVKATGKVKWLMVTHLTRGNADREREIKTLLNKAKLLGVDLTDAILGGDLNDANDSSQPGARRAAGTLGLTDIRDQLSDEDFTGDSWDTFTGWDADVEKNGRHIDAILNGTGSRPVKGAIVPVRNGASDHQLVRVEIH